MDPKLASMASQLNVEFQNVQEHYSSNESIVCKYKLNDYKTQYGDRIAIFKNGWTSLKSYVLFEWVHNAPKNCQNCVVFKGLDLQMNDFQQDDLYQFCYISSVNVIQGISAPFQVTSMPPKPLEDTDMISHLKQALSLKDQEIAELKEENVILKESLKSLVRDKNNIPDTHETEISSLKDVTKQLQEALKAQQREIDNLKKLFHVEHLKVECLEVEKNIAQKKFQALLNNEHSSASQMYDFPIEDLQSLPPFPLDYD